MRTHIIWLIVTVAVGAFCLWLGDVGACQRARVPQFLQGLPLADAQGKFLRRIGEYDVFTTWTDEGRELWMINVAEPQLYFHGPWDARDPNGYFASLGPWYSCMLKGGQVRSWVWARNSDPNQSGETLMDTNGDGRWDRLHQPSGVTWIRAGDEWQRMTPTTTQASSQPADDDANSAAVPQVETKTFEWRGDRTYTIGYSNDMYGGVSRAFVRCDEEVVWATEGTRFSVREIGDPNAGDPRIWDTETSGPIVVFFDWNLSGKGGGLLDIVSLGEPVETLDVVDVPDGGEIRDIDGDGMFEIMATDEAYLSFGGGSRADSPHPRVVLRYHRSRFAPWLPEANARTVLRRANEAVAGVSADAVYQLDPALVGHIVDQLYGGQFAAARATFDAQASLPADVRTACWLELLNHLPASNYGPDVLAWGLAAYVAAHDAPVLLPTEPKE